MSDVCVCEECSKDFERRGSRGNAPRFCPDCRDEREKQQRRESAQRWKKAHPEQVKAYASRYRSDHLADYAAAARTYYAGHKEKVSGAQNARLKRHSANLDLWKRTQGCASCGTKDGALHYHHVDPSSKSMAVSHMFGVSIERLYDEIAKCSVLCPSCHGAAHRELRSAAA